MNVFDAILESNCYFQIACFDFLKLKNRLSVIVKNIATFFSDDPF